MSSADAAAQAELASRLLSRRRLLPFVRRIISDVTRDGGFPPLNVDTVDFMSLYRQELARRAQAQAQQAAPSEQVN